MTYLFNKQGYLDDVGILEDNEHYNLSISEPENDLFIPQWILNDTGILNDFQTYNLI